MAPLMILDDGITFHDDDVIYFPDEYGLRRAQQQQQQQQRHPPAHARSPSKTAPTTVIHLGPRRPAPALAHLHGPTAQQQQHQQQHRPPVPGGTPRRRRHVSFRDTRRVREIDSHRQYSHAEKAASWYDKAELRAMKDDANVDALLLEQGMLPGEADGDVCHRGLECRTLAGARRRKDHRANAYAAVFYELECQRGDDGAGAGPLLPGDVDRRARAVADVYGTCSESCQFAAHMRGLRDAMAVQKQQQPQEEGGARYPITGGLLAPSCHRSLQQQHEQQQDQLLQQKIQSLSCYGMMMNLASSPAPPSSSAAAASTSVPSLPSLPNISALYWERVISSSAA
jgi:hypothetical protein